MHLLYCDETNLEERAGDFLLYAGIAIDANCAAALSHEIDQIRAHFGIDRSIRLKFNPAPENLTHDNFVATKQAIIEAAIKHGVQLLAYGVLHDIALDRDEARRNGINTVCYHFDCLLHRVRDTGLVLIDRFTDAGNRIDNHLSEKFAIGVTGLPFSREYRLGNIVGFHYSAIGQSHFTSIIDIVLGTLRFGVNAHTRDSKERLDTARRLLAIVAPLFHRNRDGRRVSELGLILSPKTVISDRFRARYQALKDFLASAGIELEQEITSEHTI